MDFPEDFCSDASQVTFDGAINHDASVLEEKRKKKKNNNNVKEATLRKDNVK